MIDGSIIAAIISVHTPRNATRARPIVPGMTPMSAATAMVATQASAATTSSTDVSTIDRRRGRAAARVTRSGHAAQENGAENPDVPSPEYSIPSSEIREPTPSPTVRLVFTGWATLWSSTAPRPGLVMSATVTSTSSPTVSVWRPSSSPEADRGDDLAQDQLERHGRTPIPPAGRSR